MSGLVWHRQRFGRTRPSDIRCTMALTVPHVLELHQRKRTLGILCAHCLAANPRLSQWPPDPRDHKTHPRIFRGAHHRFHRLQCLPACSACPWVLQTPAQVACNRPDWLSRVLSCLGRAAADVRGHGRAHIPAWLTSPNGPTLYGTGPSLMLDCWLVAARSCLRGPLQARANDFDCRTNSTSDTAKALLNRESADRGHSYTRLRHGFILTAQTR